MKKEVSMKKFICLIVVLFITAPLMTAGQAYIGGD